MNPNEKYNQKSEENSNVISQSEPIDIKDANLKKRKTLPLSDWILQVKVIENIIRQDRKTEAYLKAKNLFLNMIHLFSERWDLGSFTDESNKRFIYNLRLVSPSLSSNFNKILNFFPNNKSIPQSREEIHEIIYHLKNCLYSMNPNDEDLSKLRILDKTLPNSDKGLKKDEIDNPDQNNAETIAYYPSEFIDKNDKIWVTLRKAILNYEYRSKS